MQIASRLESFPHRGAGTDSERRAARWLADELAQSGRDVVVETFWCRPNWAMAHAWHVALAIAGSLVSVSSARAGGGMLLAAALFVVLDELTGFSPGRRLTAERASQNVVARSRESDPDQLRLILTANYDSGRAGLVYRDSFRRPSAAARRVTRRLSLGWLGWLIGAIAWLEATAILRIEGDHSKAISIVQLPPTIALVVALALLLELASSGVSPGAGDNGTGVGVAVSLLRALDTARHTHVVTDVVLAGAGDGDGAGLRRYLRVHRRELPATHTAIIGVAPCGAGAVRWWRSDGRLWPLLYAVQLRRLSAEVAAGSGYLNARRRDGRGATPALPSRRARIPAIAIGCLDERGLVPRSHQPGDTSAGLDPAAADAAVQFGLLLVDAIDGVLAANASRRAASRGSATPA